MQVSIALEEMGLAYDAHTINIMKDEQFTPEFLAVNPNNKIPAITDPDGPGEWYALTGVQYNGIYYLLFT